jgi:hypothetical protein
VLVGVFPMRSGCREPSHSGRFAIIRASMQTAQGRSCETERMGNAATCSGLFSVTP